ncbi:MAG: arylsulfatase [Cyclobacteriaceae bacterium]|nr:arylsulfatase [Cyclobacteriaceae bacterium]
MMRAFSLFFALIFLIACSDTKQLNTRPNIIVVLVDDMGFSDIGCYGSEIETPNIDKLGLNGIRFTQFYNAARCCPSRASLLTGLYPHQAGMGGMVATHGRVREPGAYQGWLSENAVTLAEVLKQSGYRTYMAGKWHVGEDSLDWPVQRGFDKYFGLISGACSYFEVLPNRKIVTQNTLCTSLPEGFYMTHAVTDSAANFVQQGIESEQPFFLYLAYTAPHWPLHAVKDKINKYRGKYLVGWDSIRNHRHQKQLQLGLFDSPVRLSPREEVVPAWSEVANKEEWDLKMAVYAAMMESVDEGIGKIVHQLEQTGQLDNTLILFLSDNGACHETLDGRVDKDLKEFAAIAKILPPGEKGSYAAYGKEWANASNTPFRLYKHWAHEGGIATPFIVHYPNMISKAGIEHAPAHMIDIMPTLIELAGAPYPQRFGPFDIQPMEGKSLVPLLQGEQWKRHEFLFWEHEGSRAVRTNRWKLVAEPRKPWELYDLVEDRSEIINLANQFPDTVSLLAREYAYWAARMQVKAVEN